MIAARPLPTALHSYRALSKLIYQKTAPSSNAAWSWKETKSSPDAAAATRGVGACSQQFCAVPGGKKIFGSQWPAPQSKSMQKGRAQPEPGVCLDAAALSCAKLNSSDRSERLGLLATPAGCLRLLTAPWLGSAGPSVGYLCPLSQRCLPFLRRTCPFSVAWSLKSQESVWNTLRWEEG